MMSNISSKLTYKTEKDTTFYVEFQKGSENQNNFHMSRSLVQNLGRYKIL
jgi:hypothetical protein